jgi:transcriptional regulator GlxA family with amidase domain
MLVAGSVGDATLLPPPAAGKIRRVGRRIAILVFDGVQVLDAAGPAEVFSIAERIRPGSYAVEIVAARGGPVATTGPLTLVAERWRGGDLDTLIVAGGTGVRAAAADPSVLRWVRAAARRSRRVASVCTGAFVLAEAGLLDGRRATTHWSACDALARQYPAVRVERDPIHVRDGHVLTSAGITAGMDLALAMVEDDLGHAVALETARWLVLFVQRPGGQAQFSASLAAQRAERAPLRELQAWILDNLDADLSVPALAARAHMSPRHFARAFAAEIGATPAKVVEALRLEAARLAVETSHLHLDHIAASTGFGDSSRMRRAFVRAFGMSPQSLRRSTHA